MTRQGNIAQSILRILDQCRPFALPEETLRNQLAGLQRPATTEAEATAALDQLQAKGYIGFLKEDLDDGRKFLIREAGEVALHK